MQLQIPVTQLSISNAYTVRNLKKMTQVNLNKWCWLGLSDAGD